MEKNTKILVTFMFMFLALSFVISAEEVDKNPIPISPGRDIGIAVVEHSCPTFSWSGVVGATAYRITIFETITEEVLPYDDMFASARPLMSKEIPGQALAWTPSAHKGLRTGGLFVWYVVAVDAQGNYFGKWSEGKTFKVELTVRWAGIKEKLKESLKEYGLSEDVINGALKDLEPKVTEVEVKGSSTIANNQPVVKPLGLEVGTNTFFGDGAGADIDKGSNNTFIGYYAGNKTDDGILNTFIGSAAGENNTLGSSNTYVGRNAGYSNVYAEENTIVGCQAGVDNTANANTFMGRRAGYENSTGYSNTFIGRHAGHDNTSGNLNTFLGCGAGDKNSIADNNTFLGYGAGSFNTEGHDNIFIGKDAGKNNAEASYNTIIGTCAGDYKSHGDGNTFLGYQAGGTNYNGHGNIFLGHEAGLNETGSHRLYIDNTDTSDPLIYGEFDTDLVGINGKLGVGTKNPSSDIEIKKSGLATLKITNVSGATFKLTAGLNNVQIGAITDHGIKYLAGGSWKMQLNANGNLYMKDGGSYTGTWNNASSRELKENIEPISSNEAVDTLENLEPVKYNYKKDKQELHAGFIAEDVPELVATNSRKNLSTMDIVAVLTKVVKEQQSKITELEHYKKKQEKVINGLIKRIDKIENR